MPERQPPDYFGLFQTKMLRNAQHADALNRAGWILSGHAMPELQKRAGDDPSQINHVIDAVLDEFIATCDGNERAALFAALSMYGQAMVLLSGPPGAAHA